MERSLDFELKAIACGGLALFGCWTLQILLGITVRNPLTVVFFAFLFWAAERAKKGGPVQIGISFAMTGLMTLLTWNRSLGTFESSLFKIISRIIVVAGFFCLTYVITGLIYAAISKDIGNKVSFRKDVVDGGKPFTGVLAAFIIALICLVFWLPYFLYEFPGIMTADSLVQFSEIMGDEPWSNHHPVVHTLLLWALYDIGVFFTGDPEIGIAFYTGFQMLFMAFCCGVLTTHLKSRRNQIKAVIFYSLVPFNVIFAITVWKDIIFAGITMLLMCLVIDMRKEDRSVSFLQWTGFVLLSILFALLRSNAWIAYILWIPFLLIAFRKDIAKAGASVAIVVLTVVIIKGPVMSAFGVGQPDFVESLSVPAQQIARVLVDEEEIDDKEKLLIENVIDTTYIKELYAPDFADNMKELMRAGNPAEIEQNKKSYFVLWLHLCLKHPGTVTRAWYDLVGGYIYPDVNIRVADMDGIMNNDYNLYWNPLIGGRAIVKAKEIAIKLGNFIPVYGMLWSIGAFTWLLVISTIISLVKREHVLCKILLLLLVLTLLIAAPVVDFRYGYAIVMTLPLWAFYNINAAGARK